MDHAIGNDLAAFGMQKTMPIGRRAETLQGIGHVRCLSWRNRNHRNSNRRSHSGGHLDRGEKPSLTELPNRQQHNQSHQCNPATALSRAAGSTTTADQFDFADADFGWIRLAVVDDAVAVLVFGAVRHPIAIRVYFEWIGFARIDLAVAIFVLNAVFDAIVVRVWFGRIGFAVVDFAVGILVLLSIVQAIAIIDAFTFPLSYLGPPHGTNYQRSMDGG